MLELFLHFFMAANLFCAVLASDVGNQQSISHGPCEEGEQVTKRARKRDVVGETRVDVEVNGEAQGDKVHR